MSNGDTVRVWPHGDDASAAIGRIVIISENQRSIAVAFGDPPPFLQRRDGPIAVHPEQGFMLVAYREAVGPWVELGSGGHYEIEAA